MRANILKRKLALRVKRKKRVRADISGTEQRPRVSFFKSNRYVYAQAIDDVNGVTLAAEDGKKLGFNASKQGATEVGKVARIVAVFTEYSGQHRKGCYQPILYQRATGK